MKKLIIILIYIPLAIEAQYQHIYYSGISLVTMNDDFYIRPVLQDKIIATSTFLPRYEGDYVSVMTKGTIIDSLQAESEMDAVVKSNWKNNYMLKSGAESRNVLIRGENNKYYIIRFKNQWKS